MDADRLSLALPDPSEREQYEAATAEWSDAMGTGTAGLPRDQLPCEPICASTNVGLNDIKVARPTLRE